MFVAKKNCREKGKSRFGVGYIVGMLFLQKKKKSTTKEILGGFCYFCQRFYAYFCCEDPMIEVFNHAPKFSKCVS
jgi:hypothetical protein